MLRQIIINNFIFIEKAVIEFDYGFNVITGETGSGKSIFLNALNITLGNKVSESLIQINKDFLKVTSVFDIASNQNLKNKIKEFGIEIEDDILTITREVARQGKSKCYINGIYVSLSTLRQIVISLIDIHSQHQNQKLLDSKNHLFFYDQIMNLEGEREKYLAEYQNYLKLKIDFQIFEKKKKKLEDEKNFIQFTISEMGNNCLTEKDYTEIKSKINSLDQQSHFQNIFQEILNQIDTNTLSSLAIIEKKISLLKNYKDSRVIERYKEKLLNAIQDIEELKIFSLSKVDQQTISPETVDEYHKKLANAEALRKKYGLSFEDLTNKLDEEKKKLEFLENVSFNETELLEKLDFQKKKVLNLAKELQEKRDLAKVEFEKLINEKISFLGMEISNISIKFDFSEELTQDGLASGIFTYRSAPEMPFVDLTKIASGGEISRVMLAFKSVLSKTNSSETIVLDEIDVGIGGKIAFALGKEMKNIVNNNKQLLVITHLPQIAKYADKHFLIEKSVHDQVLTSVKTLSPKERTQEISRMLGGDKIKEDMDYATSFLKKDFD